MRKPFFEHAETDNTRRRPLHRWIPVAAASVVALIATASVADNAGSTGHRRVLAQFAGSPVQRTCVRPNCATVLAVRHGDRYESGPVAQVRGPLMSNPPLGIYNPHVPPVMQSAFPVQRRKDVWVVEVLRRDGTVQVIQQNYPALFQVGEEVLVEGDRVRVAD